MPAKSDWEQFLYRTTGQFEKCKQYMAVAGELCVIGQLVLRGTRIVIPKKLQPRTLALAHEGHLGVVGTKQNLRTKVWWPGMDKAADILPGMPWMSVSGIARPP